MKKLLLSAFLILMCSQVSAVQVTLSNPYFFRSITGPNSVNYLQGDTLLIGAYASPTVGTTLVAQQGAVSVPLGLVGDVVAPNEFSAVIPYNPSLTSEWTITATNGADSSQAVTNAINNVAALPFVENVALTSSTGELTPTISWTVPNIASNANRVRVGVYDDATNKRLFLGTGMPLTTTSFIVPTDLLSPGGSYAIRVLLEDVDQEILLSRAQTFVNFTPITTTQPVILPSTTIDSNLNDNFGAPFLFTCNVKAGETVLIDPFVAIGYDYAIGKNDPKFATVTLPFLGDNQYELWLFNGTDFVFTNYLTAGTTYYFGEKGVALFRILGIEDSLAIDPANATAFITGLTFISDGRFTGSMTPIINRPVPEPTQITIDIKPGSYPNSINFKSNGVVPVAILSTIDFEATAVDPDTVLFADASPVKWMMEDINQDGDMDLLLHFRTQELNLTQDSAEATLTGETTDGTHITGTDKVNIVPKKKK
jgi:hypothetical protein